jgi:hypothetical protein
MTRLLIRPFEPSWANFYLCLLAGLVIPAGSIVLLLLGESQAAIVIALLGVFSMLVEGHCASLAERLKPRTGPTVEGAAEPLS